jgi:hypothetical protein
MRATPGTSWKPAGRLIMLHPCSVARTSFDNDLRAARARVSQEVQAA